MRQLRSIFIATSAGHEEEHLQLPTSGSFKIQKEREGIGKNKL